MITIAVDAYGGDHAPMEIVKGAVMACTQDKDLRVILVGKKQPIEELLQQAGNPDRIGICEANDVIDCNEAPVLAVRRKKDSSIVKMFGCLSQGEADGAVSAGSTGAVLAGGIFLCGRLKGVQRPALCPVLPTVKGGNVMLVDCGANTDCKPEYLVQFAYMGASYMRCLFGTENPRIGLLSNGAEDEKGNDLVKEAHRLIAAHPDLNLVRNAEARELLSGDFDVIVCDGFNGNIALKSAEGTANAVFSLMKAGIAESFRAKIGAFLLKPVLKKIKKRLDYNEVGGAAFLGVNKPLVKAHGAAKAKSMCAAILQCKQMVQSGVVDTMAKSLGTVLNDD